MFGLELVLAEDVGVHAESLKVAASWHATSPGGVGDAGGATQHVEKPIDATENVEFVNGAHCMYPLI
jgi:hypothetical protein